VNHLVTALPGNRAQSRYLRANAQVKQGWQLIRWDRSNQPAKNDQASPDRDYSSKVEPGRPRERVERRQGFRILDRGPKDQVLSYKPQAFQVIDARRDPKQPRLEDPHPDNTRLVPGPKQAPEYTHHYRFSPSFPRFVRSAATMSLRSSLGIGTSVRYRQFPLSALMGIHGYRPLKSMNKNCDLEITQSNEPYLQGSAYGFTTVGSA
jgi:hypothetical protein